MTDEKSGNSPLSSPTEERAEQENGRANGDKGDAAVENTLSEEATVEENAPCEKEGDIEEKPFRERRAATVEMPLLENEATTEKICRKAGRTSDGEDAEQAPASTRDSALRAERLAARISSAWSLGVARLKEIVKPERAVSDGAKDVQKQKKRTLSMKTFFALLIMAEVLIIVAGSSGILELVHSVFEGSRDVHDVVWLVSISVILGIATTVFLIRFFSAPLLTLGASIKRVAGGDFSVRLDTDRGFSELRRISGDFNVMVEELSATEILQTDFVSNVSHEFKTPITAIEGYATLLGGSEGTSPEQAEYIDKILLNTKRLSNLVGNILLLSKVDNQGIPDRKTLFRLDEQIRQSILALEPRWTEKECEFDVEMEELYYEGNEALTFHVWNNLIENAIKFGPRGGCIKITLARDGERLIFTVSDMGEGISDEAKLHIFDRFYQSDSSHKSEGNGLGLALVKRIISAEGGEVSVSDNYPEGAKFTVALPSPEQNARLI